MLLQSEQLVQNRKRNFLINEGYDEVIVRKENFRDQLKNALGERKLNLVLESIGGKIFNESFKALAPSGRIIVYGGAQFMSKSSQTELSECSFQIFNQTKSGSILSFKYQ